MNERRDEREEQTTKGGEPMYRYEFCLWAEGGTHVTHWGVNEAFRVAGRLELVLTEGEFNTLRKQFAAMSIGLREIERSPFFVSEAVL